VCSEGGRVKPPGSLLTDRQTDDHSSTLVMKAKLAIYTRRDISVTWMSMRILVTQCSGILNGLAA